MNLTKDYYLNIYFWSNIKSKYTSTNHITQEEIKINWQHRQSNTALCLCAHMERLWYESRDIICTWMTNIFDTLFYTNVWRGCQVVTWSNLYVVSSRQLVTSKFRWRQFIILAEIMIKKKRNQENDGFELWVRCLSRIKMLKFQN